jgi:hypothetical protein
MNGHDCNWRPIAMTAIRSRPARTRFAGATIIAILASLTSTVSSVSQASVPSDKTIFSRLARHSGKGAYVIEQEVQFRSLSEPVILRERWVVNGGEVLRVSANSPKSATEQYRFEAVYRDGKRTLSDGKGGTRAATLSQEFIEPYSHYRTGRSFVEALVFSRILPTSALKEKTKPPRLGRSNGVITWIFGEPTPVDAGKLNPSAWVEQDAFVMRRLRFPSQAEVSFDNPSSYANGLRLARDRTVTWENNTVTIRVLSVKPTSEPSSTSSLAAAKLPDAGPVKEFYSRFR